jgi:hypothetical protein
METAVSFNHYTIRCHCVVQFTYLIVLIFGLLGEGECFAGAVQVMDGQEPAGLHSATSNVVYTWNCRFEYGEPKSKYTRIVIDDI